MRQVVNIENGQVAFGYDRAMGVFIQVFKDDKDEPVCNYDQSKVLMGLSFGEKINREVINAILETYPEAKKPFEEFEKMPFGDLIIGYVTDEKGYHDGRHYIETYADWINFFEKVEKNFILTDAFDLLILQR